MMLLSDMKEGRRVEFQETLAAMRSVPDGSAECVRLEAKLTALSEIIEGLQRLIDAGFVDLQDLVTILFAGATIETEDVPAPEPEPVKKPKPKAKPKAKPEAKAKPKAKK